MLKSAIRLLALFLLVPAASLRAAAQRAEPGEVPTGGTSSTGKPDLPQTSATSSQPEVSDAPAANIFRHSETARYLISGQANIVFQTHGPFHSPYEGSNSFLGRGEYKTSLVGTLFLGYELRRSPGTHTEVVYDEESAGGRGLSEALGLAGFTNLDVVRNPSLGSTPYLARVELHQTIELSRKFATVDRGPFSMATQIPVRRLDLRIGKLGLPDFFDLNGVGTDSHLQFLNWTTDNNGAWDYAADTRGYTYAAIAEYDDGSISARYAFAAMPSVANGIDFDWNLRRSSGQNAEFEWRHNLLGRLTAPDRKGAVRAISFINHAHMGLYRDAVKAYLAGTDSTPDITKHETFGAVKYGFGLNAEQELTPNLRLYGRVGWNEGQHESYAYTEVDQTISLGGDYSLRHGVFGLPGRPNDKVGIAFVSNAIKRDHQTYLRLGGQGFILGDGRLNYAREDILEGYYNLHTWRGLFYALDAQYITHPGYNQERGPVLVEAVRMHVDF